MKSIHIPFALFVLILHYLLLQTPEVAYFNGLTAKQSILRQDSKNSRNIHLIIQPFPVEMKLVMVLEIKSKIEVQNRKSKFKVTL